MAGFACSFLAPLDDDHERPESAINDMRYDIRNNTVVGMIFVTAPTAVPNRGLMESADQADALWHPSVAVEKSWIPFAEEI